MEISKCKKIQFTIECTNCGYPYSEARYPDNYDNPLSCTASNEELREHIDSIQKLEDSQSNHFLIVSA